MTAQDIVVLAMQVSIVAMVFTFGLEATLDDVLYVVRRPRQLARSLLAMFVLMPLAAIGLDKVFDLRLHVEVILMALALSPVPPLLLRKETQGGGHVSYGLGLMVTVLLLSIALTPLAVSLLDPFFDRSFSVRPWTIAKLVFAMAIVPLGVGIVVRRTLPALAARLTRPVRRVATLILVGASVAILAASAKAVMALAGDDTLVVIFLFIVVGLAGGHWLGGPDPTECEVLALSTASRHPGIAIAVATANFPGENGFVPVVLLYVLMNTAVSFLYIAWQKRRLGRKAAV